jgi:hypothetical protein
MKGTYGKSSDSNFEVTDTIGVPHPYCIGPKHVGYAADRFGGILNEDAIRSAESAGAKCCTCKGKLSYDQHEQALLVTCKKDFQTDKTAEKELHAYLLSIKDEATKHGYAGFAFVKK